MLIMTCFQYNISPGTGFSGMYEILLMKETIEMLYMALKVIILEILNCHRLFDGSNSLEFYCLFHVFYYNNDNRAFKG